MKITLLNAFLETKYENYILTAKEGMFFYSLKYKKFLEKLLCCGSQYCLVVDENDDIQAVMPMMMQRGTYGIVYNSLPFYGSHGGILASNPEAAQLLRDHFDIISKQTDTAINMLITNPLSETHILPIYDYFDKRISQITPIQYSEDVADQLLLSFHSKTRNMIRKASKSDLKIVINNDAFEFLAFTHKENMAAIGGTPKTARFFELIPEIFRAGFDYKIYVAKKDDKAIAAVLLFYYKGMVEYFTPVVNAAYRSFQPMSLLIYTAMIDAAKEGFHAWNWGGTWLSQDGVYRFKSRFGSVDREYYYHIKLNNKSVLSATSMGLLGEYPGFYTVPFEALVEYV